MGDGSIHMRQLDRGWINHVSVCCLYASGCRDIGASIFEMVKNSNFFELFGPPCGNLLANLDGSMPECAQVCAPHTRPHLTMLRKTETVGRLSYSRRNPQNWYYVTQFFAHPVERRERWVHTHAKVGYGMDKAFFSVCGWYASIYNSCINIGNREGCKFSKWSKNRFYWNFLAHPVETPWPTWMAQCQNVRRSVP